MTPEALCLPNRTRPGAKPASQEGAPCGRPAQAVLARHTLGGFLGGRPGRACAERTPRNSVPNAAGDV